MNAFVVCAWEEPIHKQKHTLSGGSRVWTAHMHSLIQNNNPSSQSRIASMVATWPIIHVPLPVKPEVN